MVLSSKSILLLNLFLLSLSSSHSLSVPLFLFHFFYHSGSLSLFLICQVSVCHLRWAAMNDGVSICTACWIRELAAGIVICQRAASDGLLVALFTSI